MISLSIDITQLVNTRFKEITRKNGQKAIFCDLILIETPDGKYGDYMVKQSMTKEERQRGLELPILGNGKVVGSKPQNERREASRTQETSTPEDPKTGLPF